MYQLASQIFVDNSDLNIMNNGLESENTIIQRAQQIIKVQYRNLQITRGKLKLSKCYQTLISYQQKNNKAILIKDQYYNLTINLDERDQEIPYLLPYKTRSLMEVMTNLSNNNSNIITTFQNKLSQYTNSLILAKLSPLDIMIGYNAFQWSFIKFIAPALIFPPSSNLLHQFHRILLLQISINRNIPEALILTPFI